MAKHRKDYRVARQPELLIGEPRSLMVNFLDDRCQLKHSFDFSIYAKHGELVAELALAFRQHHAGDAEIHLPGTGIFVPLPAGARGTRSIDAGH